MSVGPGWFPDPSGAVQQRWWDGVQWTADVRAYSVTSMGKVLVRRGDTLRIEKPHRRKETEVVFEVDLDDLESIPYVHTLITGDYVILLLKDPVRRAQAREGEKATFNVSADKKDRAALAEFLAPIIQARPGLVDEQTQRERNKRGSAYIRAALRGESEETANRAGQRIVLASQRAVPELFVYEREIWRGSPDMTAMSPVGGPIAGARAELRISGNKIVTSEGSIKTGPIIHHGWTERDRRDFLIHISGRGFAFDVIGHTGLGRSERDFVSVVNEINALSHAAEANEPGQPAAAAAAIPEPGTVDVPILPGGGITDELHRLADLHTRGLLDDDEFRQAKARLLGSA